MSLGDVGQVAQLLAKGTIQTIPLTKAIEQLLRMIVYCGEVTGEQKCKER